MQSARALVTSAAASVVPHRAPGAAASSPRGGRAPVFYPAEVEAARQYYVRQHVLLVTAVALVLGIVVRAFAADASASLWHTLHLLGWEVYDFLFGVDWPGLPRRHGLRYYLSTEFWASALFGTASGAGDGVWGASPPGVVRTGGKIFRTGAPVSEYDTRQGGRLGVFPALAYGLYSLLPSAATVVHLLLRTAVVCAGCLVFKWGVTVVGGVPRLWELRLAFDKLIADLEGKPLEQQQQEKGGSKANGKASGGAPAPGGSPAASPRKPARPAARTR